MSRIKSINLLVFSLILLLVLLLGACHLLINASSVGNTVDAILYCAPRSDENELYIGGGVYAVSIDSSKAICLTDALENERMPYCDFDWSSVRGQIVFVSERNDGTQQIYRVNVDGSGLVNLSNGNDCDCAGLDWSPDAESIAFVTNDGLYTMRNDGTSWRKLHDYYATRPYWSPDSTRIAFGAIEDGEYVIYVITADGSDLRQITQSRGNIFYLDWSPDGTKIAFRGTNHDIVVANADGSGEMRLTNNSYVDDYPNWSLDGNQIAFQSNRDDNWEIYVMNADGSGQTRLTHNSIDDKRPIWSPDGTKIAFVSGGLAVEGWEIYLMNVNGSAQVSLTSDLQTKSNIRW